MNLDSNNLREFFNDFTDLLIEQMPNQKEINPEKIAIDLDTPNECHFVIDFMENKIIEKKGFKAFMGYKNEEVTLELLLNSYHQDDSYFVKRLIKIMLTEILDISIHTNQYIWNMAYRIRKKDGTYKYIISQTFAQANKFSSKITRALVKYSDVSFLESSNYVKWEVNPKLFDRKKIEKLLYNKNKDIFTRREIEIIELINQDKSNSQISYKLNISIHTVATHRKNILKKCNCNCTKGLLLFCKKNGILKKKLTL